MQVWGLDRLEGIAHNYIYILYMHYVPVCDCEYIYIYIYILYIHDISLVNPATSLTILIIASCEGTAGLDAKDGGKDRRRSVNACVSWASAFVFLV